MKRWHSFLLGLLATLLWVTPARAIDPSEVMDGLRDKGKDWIKGKAEDWVFETGQSETMHDILEAAREAAFDINLDAGDDKRCKGNVKGLAGQVLADIGGKYTFKTVAKVGFKTLTTIGSLAMGGLGATGEGAGLAWLAKQYADAAKDAATDAAKEAIKKAFGKEKAPEFEVFTDEGTVSPGCSYKLSAMWDIVGGTYSVYIEGDCHPCKVVRGSQLLEPTSIGKWWILFEGKMVMHIVDKTAVKFEPVKPPKMDYDAQCGCGTKVMRRAVYRKVVKTSSTTGGKTGTGTTDGGTTGGGATGGTTTPPPPPPIPPKGRQVCAECQGIQDKIDEDSDALDQARIERDHALEQGHAVAQRDLKSDQAWLQEFKGHPTSDTTEAEINARIAADNAKISEWQAKVNQANAEIARLENELRSLGVQLEECIKKCGHASMNRELKNTLFNIGLDKALHKHRKKDNNDAERRREEEQQNASHDDNPWH